MGNKKGCLHSDRWRAIGGGGLLLIYAGNRGVKIDPAIAGEEYSILEDNARNGGVSFPKRLLSIR